MLSESSPHMIFCLTVKGSGDIPAVELPRVPHGVVAEELRRTYGVQRLENAEVVQRCSVHGVLCPPIVEQEASR